MKRFFLVSWFLLSSVIVFSQQGKKPPQKDKPPTQKELADMMKEVPSAFQMATWVKMTGIISAISGSPGTDPLETKIPVLQDK